MKTITWFKFKFSSSTRAGRSGKEKTNSLCSKSNVNEEYKEAFRTKSYTEMWSKVEGQMRRTNFDKLSSSSSSRNLYMHLSEYLLEPSQDTLADMIKRFNLHHLLISYFEASLEACNICELLLRSIHQTRSNYRIINRVIKLTQRVHDRADYTDEQCRAIFGELAKFTLLNNPLSVINPVQFHDIHDSYKAFLHRLTTKYKKIRRKAKSSRFWRKVAGYSIVISYGALAVTLLVLAFHSMVGVFVAAPGVVLACSLGLLKKMIKLAKRGLKTRLGEKLGAQIDVAAKGVYILINDFDTMSRLVGRLHDEVEHSKAIADICVRNGKGQVLLKEVVKEFHMHEPCFMEQLEELEEHIYLCFLTINRSRRLVVQEIMVPQQ